MADAHKNFAYSTVATAPSPASSGTSLVVAAGEGALFPAVPFNATLWPAGAQPLSTTAEIVRVTARSTDTLTITRAQEGSSARTVVVGDQIAATITAKTLTDAENSSPGTSFPASPATNDLFYRTDLALLFFYDGTRWLTVNKYLKPFSTVLSVDASPFDAQMGAYTQLDMWLEAVITMLVIGATNTGSHYWTMTLNKYDAASAGTSIVSFNTSADSANTTILRRTTIGAALGGSATYKRLIHSWGKTGSPTTGTAAGELEYRLIGT